MRNKFILYVHLSPSNKRYFGITCRDINRRWGKDGIGYKQNKYFWNAIKKYGWDNFKHIILMDNLSKSWAIQLERLLILQFKSYEFEYGYNRAIGGDYGGSGYTWSQSESVRKHLSDIKKGIKFTDNHKEALKQGWKHRKENGKGDPWNKGLSLKQTGKIDNFIKAGIKNGEKQKRKIYQLDLNNNIIAEYNSVSEASRAIGANNKTGIFAVANGRGKTAYGYIWRYKE